MIENILKEARSDSRYPALGIAFVVVVIEHLFIREYVGDAIAIFRILWIMLHSCLYLDFDIYHGPQEFLSKHR